MSKKEEHVTKAAFELEQVLFFPYGTTSIFYYCRRIKNHNLTVIEVDTMTIHTYLEGRKGSCEVAA